MSARVSTTVALLALAVSAAVAQAEPGPRVVVAELSGEKPEAMAVTLLLRSALSGGKRPAVPAAELAKVGGDGALSVGSASTARVLAATGADRLVLGTVERAGARVVVTYRTFNAANDPLGAGGVVGLPAELDLIVKEVAKRIAAAVGSEAIESAIATPDEIAPYAAAATLAGSDPARAAEALSVADPAVAARAPAARDLAERLAPDPKIPAARGNKADPASKLQRAEQARGSGAAPAEYLRELLPLLTTRPAQPRVVAWATRLPAGVLGEAAERVVLDAARSLATSHPALARAAALRAVEGGIPAADAVGDLPLDGFSRAALSALAAKPSGLSARVQATLEARKRAAPHDWNPSDDAPRPEADDKPAVAAKLVAAPAAPPPTVKKAQAESPEVAALADALTPLFEKAPALAEHAGGKIQLERAPSASLFASRWVDLDLLKEGLASALAREPYRLSSEPAKDGAALIVTYGAQPAGGSARVDLDVRDVTAGQTQSIHETIAAHRSGLVRLSLRYFISIALLVLIVLVTAGLVARRIVRVGDVRVDLKNDLGAQKDTLAIRLTKSPSPPKVGNFALFDKKERKQGPVTVGRHRSLAAGSSLFHRVPQGRWYVHVYGVFERDGQFQELPEGLSRPIDVERGKVSIVTIALHRNVAEVRIQVAEGRPLKDAVVVVDAIPNVLKTAADGTLKVLLPFGEHVIRIEARGLQLERQITIADATPQSLSIDMIAERNANSAPPPGAPETHG